MTIDLDLLERLEREWTPAPWGYKLGDIVQLSMGDGSGPLDYYPDCADVLAKDRDGDRSISDADCELIAAIRSAAPALLRLARAAVAWRTVSRPSLGTYPAESELVAAIDALVKRD